MTESDSDTEHFLADWYICKICRNVFHSKILLYDHKRTHYFDYVETASEGTRRRRCAEWVEKTQKYMQNLFKSGFVEDDPLAHVSPGRSNNNSSVSSPSSQSTSGSSVRILDSTTNTYDGDCDVRFMDDDQVVDPDEEIQLNGYYSIEDSKNTTTAPGSKSKPGNSTPRKRAPTKRKTPATSSAAAVNTPTKRKVGRKVARTPAKAPARKSVVSSRKSGPKQDKNRQRVSPVDGSRIAKEFRMGMDVEVRLKMEDYRLCHDCGKTFLSTAAYNTHLQDCTGPGTQRRSVRILTKVSSNKTGVFNGHGQCGRRMCTAC